MDHSTAGVDNIRDISKSFLSDWNEQGLLGLADHSPWVFKIQEGRRQCSTGAWALLRALTTASRHPFQAGSRNCRSG